MELADLLAFAVRHDASDIHLQSGAPPMVRIAGRMRPLEAEPLTTAQTHAFVAQIAPALYQERLDEAIVQGFDFSYMHSDLGRFRCSAYRHLGEVGLVMRILRAEIRSLAELHLPDVIEDIALMEQGLVLVTGTTGSGKSTTLAAMIDLINRSRRKKIISIEDPVEYVHQNHKSLVAQLELGSDTPSFEQALRQALRQDPDVILIGELRDVETLRMALRAADTGHQVFATVHSSDAAQTVERIIAMFPAAEHKLLLSQLAHSVEAIISQRLVPTREQQRRPAVEILRGGPVTENYIIEQRLDELSDYIATGQTGMQTFDQHLLELYRQDVISGTEALRHASSPEALSMGMRGIRTTS